MREETIDEGHGMHHMKMNVSIIALRSHVYMYVMYIHYRTCTHLDIHYWKIHRLRVRKGP